MSGKKILCSIWTILILLFAGFTYICWEFKSDNPYIGMFSAETFDSIQDYVDRNAELDSLQRLVGWKEPRGINYFFNSLDRFGGSVERIPIHYYEVGGLNEIIQPKGFENRLEWRMKDKEYLRHTGDLFCGGLGEKEDVARYSMKYYGSSDRLRGVFSDLKLTEAYQNEDLYFQFMLAVPTTIKRGDYKVSLLNTNYDPFHFSDKTAALISYEVSRKKNVDTYNIRVRRGDLVFETSFKSTGNLVGTSSLYRLALRKNGEVEIWAIDHWISSIKGDFYDLFKPVGPSDPEYIESTDDALKKAKEASLPLPGGIGFYGQSFETEEINNRAAFGYLHLTNSWVETQIIQKDFQINRERRILAASDVQGFFKSEESDQEKFNREQIEQTLVLNNEEEDNVKEDL